MALLYRHLGRTGAFVPHLRLPGECSDDARMCSVFHWFSESQSFKTGGAGWPDQGLPLMQVLPCPGELGAAVRALGAVGAALG